jgi:hypothetical protein
MTNVWDTIRCEHHGCHPLCPIRRVSANFKRCRRTPIPRLDNVMSREQNSLLLCLIHKVGNLRDTRKR